MMSEFVMFSLSFRSLFMAVWMFIPFAFWKLELPASVVFKFDDCCTLGCLTALTAPTALVTIEFFYYGP